MSFANPVVNAVIFQNIPGEDWFGFIGFDSGWCDGVCCFHIAVAMIYSNDFRVILDLGPASKGHALILPKQHFKDLCELDPAIAAKALPLAGKIGAAMKKALGCTGFNVVQNNGISAGQTVFHFHVHIIPRYENGPDMVTWAPGKATPEELAEISSSIREELTR